MNNMSGVAGGRGRDRGHVPGVALPGQDVQEGGDDQQQDHRGRDTRLSHRGKTFSRKQM